MKTPQEKIEEEAAGVLMHAFVEAEYNEHFNKF